MHALGWVCLRVCLYVCVSVPTHSKVRGKALYNTKQHLKILSLFFPNIHHTMFLGGKGDGEEGQQQARKEVEEKQKEKRECKHEGNGGKSRQSGGTADMMEIEE